jgi:thioredoxin-related protein
MTELGGGGRGIRVRGLKKSFGAVGVDHPVLKGIERVIDRQREEGRNPPGIEALQKRYEIRAFPTIVFAETDGRESARMEGFSGRAAFLEIMRGAARLPQPRGN